LKDHESHSGGNFTSVIRAEMWLRRQNKKLFDLSVGAGLVALLAYWLLSHFWMWWYYGGERASSDWRNYWEKVRAEVGSFGARLVRPIKVSSRLPSCLAELNRFVAIAKPDGLKQEIKPEDVVSARVDGAAVWLTLETKTHYVEFFTNGSAAPRILSFNPKQHDARLPESYEARGQWSKEEALAETLRLMKELGMRFTVGSHEVYAKEFPLTNTQVKVIPFYRVRLYSTNDILSVSAVFRVGEKAPGRLIAWENDPARELQRARVRAAWTNIFGPLATNRTTTLLTSPLAWRGFVEFNRFVSLVQPFGTDGPTKEEEVTCVNLDRDRLLMETKPHLADFFTRGRVRAAPKLRHFIASQDMSNPVAKPEGKEEARKTWYKATAKWTQQEALAETHRILEKLAIRFDVGASKVTPFTIEVPTPTGERVTVTPFWTVDLMDRAGDLKIIAEFRMGESGPGRLTEWFDHTPPEANPRTAPDNPEQ
jgi:hypothetical protein